MAYVQKDSLSPCIQTSNCVLDEWEFKKVDDAFLNLKTIIKDLPRCSILKSSDNYMHAVVRSLIFRFPDDLEILRIPTKARIQIRSSSRIGVSDLGVNRQRVDYLYTQLQKSGF
ncbi:DUF1499 domain-containing protein [Prochlorococcus sp. MIT 1341]|uniref:DUF1499 domain-containing protein n=1 Tax=Prochlorococcus sp. MIT 1341 TaxID=3096221 RepID=UPI002A74DB6C|nr:DUF1499 domain-containing protein [Prochlorococcus sp. MIT 1341]